MIKESGWNHFTNSASNKPGAICRIISNVNNFPREWNSKHNIGNIKISLEKFCHVFGHLYSWISSLWSCDLILWSLQVLKMLLSVNFVDLSTMCLCVEVCCYATYMYLIFKMYPESWYSCAGAYDLQIFERQTYGIAKLMLASNIWKKTSKQSHCVDE